jgi:hypothetical protein
MDALSDVLKVAHLTGGVFLHAAGQMQTQNTGW